MAEATIKIQDDMDRYLNIFMFRDSTSIWADMDIERLKAGHSCCLVGYHYTGKIYDAENVVDNNEPLTREKAEGVECEESGLHDSYRVYYVLCIVCS